MIFQRYRKHILAINKGCPGDTAEIYTINYEYLKKHQTAPIYNVFRYTAPPRIIKKAPGNYEIFLF